MVARAEASMWIVTMTNPMPSLHVRRVWCCEEEGEEVRSWGKAFTGSTGWLGTVGMGYNGAVPTV